MKTNKTFKGQFDTVVFMRDGKEYVVIIQEGLVYKNKRVLYWCDYMRTSSKCH